MAENEKTAPNSSVGADERQSSQSLNTNIIAQPPPKIKWLSDENKINEPLFCEYFCQSRELRCIDGTFYSVDGAESQDEIAAKISVMLIENGITTGIAKRSKSLLEALKLYCHSAPIKPSEDEIHVLNGVVKVDGDCGSPPTFIPEKKFCVNRLNVSYDHEIWNRVYYPEYFQTFLYQLLDSEDVLTLQEYLGYCLIPSTRAQTALFIIGNGGEGKSRIGVAMNAIFGSAMLSGNFQRVEDDKFFRYNLINKLLMNDDDMQMTALKSTGYIKNIITAEIPIDVEAKGKQSQQAQIYSRFLCFGNGSPKALYDKSDGFARRLLILTTKPKPADRRDNPFLADKFIVEKEKIFCWMVDGLRRLKKNNFRFTVSKKTRENVAEAVAENCNIVDFIAETDVFSESSAVSSTTLHRVYTDWCEDNGLTALKRETFINWLKSNADKYSVKYSNNIYENGKRVRGFEGIYLNG